MPEALNRMTSGVAAQVNKPDDVPRVSKQPKSRPPVGTRERILRTPLPYYSGPYSVGMMESEVPAREPRHFSEIKRHHMDLLKYETVLFSVFYPSVEVGKANLQKGRINGVLPRPRIDVAKCYGKFSGLPPWVSVAWFGKASAPSPLFSHVNKLSAATIAFTKLPAFRKAKLAGHWPSNQNSYEAGYETKNAAGTPPPGEPEKPIFPTIIFSHGLGATRTTYVSVCGEFASYSFNFISLEHRNGSGPRTFVNLPSRRNSKQEHEETKVDHSSEARGKGKGYARMDYVFPQNNPRGTMPGNERGVDWELRRAQIQLRLAGIAQAYHVMGLMNSERGAAIAAASLCRQQDGSIGGSSRGLKGVNWDAWEGRFHLRQVTMVGHMFGAATTVEVLRHKDRFEYIGQGIIYDIWGGAIQPREGCVHRIASPLLGINSEAFMYWPDTFKSIMSLCLEAKDNNALCWLMTVRGSVHISQSDFSILYPKIASLLLKMTVNPRRAIDLNDNARL
ncbi:Platelet-activating factor acetylhydrolase [Lachnellula subtilissima]|uniref:1-alkyl-2-acetylglycerophosphocholine esterase n=1 Tax=Lachnellula subtilissima TaxID=602034 RepID=A0A8H8U739_9HELO|nr:Platelet-activating factor acetylhydrolase [Lachnellula subtilissima]